MKKKTIGMIASALMVSLSVCGCAQGGNGVETEGLNEKANNRFVYEQLDGLSDYSRWCFGYVVDTETGVTYLVFSNNRGKRSIGGITPLLNRDGTPVIDDEY